MKVVVSSKNLKKQIELLGAEQITEVTVESDKVTLHSGVQSISFNAITNNQEHKLSKSKFKQDNVKWDWIYKLISLIEDQPIVIDFENKKADIIIQYY